MKRRRFRIKLFSTAYALGFLISFLSLFMPWTRDSIGLMRNPVLGSWLSILPFCGIYGLARLLSASKLNKKLNLFLLVSSLALALLFALEKLSLPSVHGLSIELDYGIVVFALSQLLLLFISLFYRESGNSKVGKKQ